MVKERQRDRDRGEKERKVRIKELSRAPNTTSLGINNQLLWFIELTDFLYKSNGTRVGSEIQKLESGIAIEMNETNPYCIETETLYLRTKYKQSINE